jgi:hypothetical protein
VHTTKQSFSVSLAIEILRGTDVVILLIPETGGDLAAQVVSHDMTEGANRGCLLDLHVEEVALGRSASLF